MVRNRELSVVWAMRLSVVSLVLTVPLLGSQLDVMHTHTRLTAVVVLWLVWAGLLLNILVPSSGSLTALRLLAPTHTGITLILVIGGAAETAFWPGFIALTISVVATVASLSGDTGRYYVQVSAYGDERRFLLACPSPMIVVQVLAWVLWFGAAVIAAVSLTGDSISSSRLIIGGVAAALTGAGFVVLPKRFHRYSRRWLVWVPAGIVLHDDVVLAETAMMSRRSLRDVGLWHPGDEPEPLNVTGGRLRSGIVISLREMETIILSANSQHPGGNAMHVQSFLIRPTRLRPALAEMTNRLSEH